MVNRHYVPVANLVNELRYLCQSYAYGTLLVTSDNNRLVQFGLADGQIAFLTCQSKQGVEALPLLRQIQHCWFRFMAGEVKTDKSLPSTETILRALEGQEASLGRVTFDQEIPATVKTVLKQALTEFIGPIAFLIADKHLAGSNDLNKVLDLMAQEIGNPNEITRFREMVLQRLS